MTPQQPRDDDAHASSDDEAGTEFSDYAALTTADDAARRRPRDARPDAWTAPVLDDALQRRPIKPPPPPAAEEIPRPRPTSVRFVPQRPPCKSLRELAAPHATVRRGSRGGRAALLEVVSNCRPLDACNRALRNASAAAG